METFKYVGRTVANDGCDTPTIQRNPKKARAKGGRLQKVTTQETVPPRVAGRFYQVVVAAQLLYGSEPWCLLAAARRPLEGFHCKMTRRLADMQTKQVKGVWVYPPTADVLRAAGLIPLEHYVGKHRHTIVTIIRDRPILKECKGAESW